jgi:DeoR family transcriptional regulator of aga operon
MLPEQRRREILEYMARQGAADVTALAEQFSVSIATIRRDLQLLHDRGHLTRTHGGAVVPLESASFEPFHSDKTRLHTKEKEAIAKAATAHVVDAEVIVLDSGSTMLALARQLKARKGLTVIATDLQIALELVDVPGFEVVLVGGVARAGHYSLVGPIAENALRELHANHAFLGADAIDLHGGLTNANIAEVAVKRLIMASADEAMLLADRSKFGRRSLARVADLTAFSQVITDDGLEVETLERYRDAGVELVRAGEPAAGRSAEFASTNQPETTNR